MPALPPSDGRLPINVVVPDVPDGAVQLTFSLGGAVGGQNLYVAVQH